jgi:formate-dependent nitrite reductase cytochrome c552 subunit
MSLELAGKDKDVKSKFEKLFLSEKEALNSTIESKDKEILELKEQLEETPNTGKIKAEINLSSRKKGESMLEAIERIKSSNK